MNVSPPISYRVVLVLVLAASLVALALSFLTPGFSLGNDLVYGAF